MHNPPSLLVPYTGEYDLHASVALAASAAFAPAMRPSPDGTGEVLDLAFPLEPTGHPVGVRIRQRGGELQAELLANPGRANVAEVGTHLARLLSLDADGTGFAAVAARDAVVARLHQQHPGLRPVLFPTPYEAAARAIIGHQLPVRQAAALAARVAASHGTQLALGDHEVAAFPPPEQLARLPAVPGLAARKVEQLRALGVAAVAGRLASARLRALPHEAALADLQQLAGIGPFSAELIMLRGVGEPDAFPATEQRLHRAMAAAYQLGEKPDLATLEQVASHWRPYRNWVGLLLRNYSPTE